MPKHLNNAELMKLNSLIIPDSYYIKICPQCRNHFVGYIFKTYCSKECRKLANPQKSNGAAKRNGKMKECKFCKKMFYASRKALEKQTYCSMECRNKARENKIIKICLNCKKEFKVKKSMERIRYCSKKCSYIYKRSLKDYDGALRIKRDMKRDGLIKECYKCGYNIHPEILVTHHIDRDRNNNVLENIAILCPNCHSKEHYVKPISGITLLDNKVGV